MIYFDNNTPKQQNDAQKKQQNNSGVAGSNNENSDTEQDSNISDDDYVLMFNRNGNNPIVGSWNPPFEDTGDFFCQPKQDSNLFESNTGSNVQDKINTYRVV